MLPKIHKPNNPGRPVVSTCSCPTEQISKYLDNVLSPIVKSLPTYNKDSSHALEIFKDFRFPNAATGPRHIFTLDVKSLYTSIPIQDGLVALRYFLDKQNASQCTTATLLRLAEFV